MDQGLRIVTRLHISYRESHRKEFTTPVEGNAVVTGENGVDHEVWNEVSTEQYCVQDSTAIILGH